MEIPPVSVEALAVPFAGSYDYLCSYVPTWWGPYIMSHKTIQLPSSSLGCENICKKKIIIRKERVWTFPQILLKWTAKH